jgi:hypothetical protein
LSRNKEKHIDNKKVYIHKMKRSCCGRGIARLYPLPQQRSGPSSTPRPLFCKPALFLFLPDERRGIALCFFLLQFIPLLGSTYGADKRPGLSNAALPDTALAPPIHPSFSSSLLRLMQIERDEASLLGTTQGAFTTETVQLGQMPIVFWGKDG